jgi:hypothetical protein
LAACIFMDLLNFIFMAGLMFHDLTTSEMKSPDQKLFICSVFFQ